MKVTVIGVKEFGKSCLAGFLLGLFAPALFVLLRALCRLPYILPFFASTLFFFASALLFFASAVLFFPGLFSFFAPALFLLLGVLCGLASALLFEIQFFIIGRLFSHVVAIIKIARYTR